MTLARTRVPLDRPLPPCIDNTEFGQPSRDHSWKDLVGVIEAARGCKFAACSRVVEDPETVIFILGQFQSIMYIPLLAPQVLTLF